MRSLLAVVLVSVPASAGAGYVTPQLGGGSPGVIASMKHADITFANNALSVHVDPSVPAPRLRPLVEGDAFDPSAPWAPLNDKGYNAQYGWNAGGFIQLPAGSAIWIEELDSTPGLEVYQAPIDANGYAPLFGTGGTSPRWKWSGRMSHNYYATTGFAEQPHEATYRVYLGDLASGAPLPGYVAAEVTFDFALPGDYDGDGSVDGADHQLWRASYGETGVDIAADGNGDGRIDAADFTVWRDAESQPVTEVATPVPEPVAASLGLLALAAGSVSRRGR